MKIVDCVQYTPEWWEARRGIPTASNFDRILTAKTMKPSAAADDYICELIGDLACLTPPFFTERGGHTPAMRNGIDTEPEARRYYEMDRNLDVFQIGFCTTDDGRFGCSPDGLVEDQGGLELKCPTLKVHVGYLLKGGLPDDYKAQVHGALIVTGRPWWDFMSYAPGLEPLLVRVEPDKYTEALRSALETFWSRYQDTLKFFKREPLTQTLEAAIAEQRSRQ